MLDKAYVIWYNVYIVYIHSWRTAQPGMCCASIPGDLIMDIIISNSSGEPIYTQIIKQIKAMILDGALQAGDALPSMRNLAMQLRISVITTKRAYEELERDGFIESYPGKGSFVKAQNREMLREEQLRQTEELLSAACEKARVCGISLEELTEILKLVYGDEGNV